MDIAERAVTPEEVEAYRRLDQRLFELGYLSKINEPITDFAPYENRKPLTIPGLKEGESIWNPDEDRR